MVVITRIMLLVQFHIAFTFSVIHTPRELFSWNNFRAYVTLQLGCRWPFRFIFQLLCRCRTIKRICSQRTVATGSRDSHLPVYGKPSFTTRSVDVSRS